MSQALAPIRWTRVYFATQPSGMTVVDRMELAAFNSTTAVYDEDPYRQMGNGWQYGLPFKRSDGAGPGLMQ